MESKQQIGGETKIYTWGVGRDGQLGVDKTKLIGKSKNNMLPAPVLKQGKDTV